MIHEGIDGEILSFFWGITKNLHLDGFTLALYGLCALALFMRYRRVFLPHKAAMSMFMLCGVFFLASLSLDIGSVDRVRIVFEESAKLIAVSFLLNGFIFVFRDTYTDLAEAVGSRQPSRDRPPFTGRKALRSSRVYRDHGPEYHIT